MFLLKTIILVVFFSLVGWLGVKWMEQDNSLQIKQIVLLNPLSQQNEKELLQLSKQVIKGNFLTLDIDDFRTQIEQLPWVEAVSVRKVWPDSLQLQIVEHKALARWSKQTGDRQSSWDNSSLLSNKGVIFKPQLTTEQYKKIIRLPLMTGPQALSEQVMKTCQQIMQKLADNGVKLEQCMLNKRRSWNIRFLAAEQQVQLMLGKSMNNETSQENQRIIEKISLFLSLYANKIKPLIAHVESIDMRYPNGFSIRWKT